MIEAIAHPTDFSQSSEFAFRHALALALHYKCRLDLLHVKQPGSSDGWESFPHVRQTLAEWGLLDANSHHDEIEARCGIKIRKIEIADHNPLHGLAEFTSQHGIDLLVAATHGFTGMKHWLSGSIASELAEGSSVPILLLGPSSRSIVDMKNGLIQLQWVLAPVADDPSPGHILSALEPLLEGFEAQVRFLHVGDYAPEIADPRGAPVPVELEPGPEATTIINIATERNVDVIAMPVSGRKGLLSLFQGSVSRDVIQNSPCPVLALPAR